MLDPGRLHSLRRQVAQIEGVSRPREGQSLRLGVAALDAALGGGLALGAVHEIAPAAPRHIGAAVGFGVALAALAAQPKPALWIVQDYAAFEAGLPYGPGLALYGLAMPRLIMLRVAQPRDALWAMEEALKSGAVAIVVAELARDGAGTDLTATRRLSLAAAEADALGLILRHHACDHASAVTTRWDVAASPSKRDAFGGLGPAAFALSLVKNRRGPTGPWHLAWDHHERAFVATLSLGVAQAARDRSHRVPLVRAG